MEGFGEEDVLRYPGRGKYLIKLGTRPGIAALELIATEERFYRTDNNRPRVPTGEARR